MSTLSLRKIKHDSSAVDNITLDSNGQVGILATPTAPLTIGRVNSTSEGGQIDLCRSTDNASTWGIDVYGNTSTPSLRIIDNVAAAVRMQIDGSGRVTMPYQPAFMVTGDSRAGYAAGTDFIYGTVRFNVGGHYSTSNGRFTAPIAGRYAFYANCMGDATDARMMTRIVINGTDYHQGSSSSNGSQYQDSKLFVLAQLNAGDYVYVRNVGNKSTYDFNQLEQWFCGYLVS